MLGAYNTFLKLASYSTTRMLDILLISITIKIIILAIAFILTIKILNKNNHELILNNISKLILATVLLQLFLGTTFSYFYLNSTQLSSAYHTPIYVYAIITCLFNYIYLNIIYLVFFSKKYIKTFTTIVLILVIVYVANISIYKIYFNKNYNNANIQNNFYIYPQINIKDVVGDTSNLNGNSAKKIVELINTLNDREQQKDTDNNSQNYIYPTENDLELLREINQAEYLSLSKEYIPDDVLLCRDCLIISLNNLRVLSRGIMKLTDDQLTQNKNTLAQENLKQLLLLGDQLLRDTDDDLIIRLVGSSIAKLSAEKLSELNPENENYTNYLTELKEIKDNFSRLMKLENNVSDEFYDSKESATYFKFYDKYKNLIYPKPIVSYTFYNMDMPIAWSSFGYADFFEESGPSIGESLLGMVNGSLTKANVGKNYTFYSKALEIQKSRNNKGLDYCINNDTMSIIKKYGSEMNRTFEIGNELNLK